MLAPPGMSAKATTAAAPTQVRAVFHLTLQVDHGVIILQTDAMSVHLLRELYTGIPQAQEVYVLTASMDAVLC